MTNHGTAAAGKQEELRSSGAVPYDYKQKDWITERQRLGGVDAVFDPLGYESSMKAILFCAKAVSWSGMGKTCLL